MMLTREDLLRGAERAESYPPGYGHVWSCIPEEHQNGYYLLNLMKGRVDPACGCPVVAITIRRKRWDLKTFYQVYTVLDRLWDRYADPPHDYLTTLHLDPLKVAAELRRIALLLPSEGGASCA